ncbi:unnamed protein product, partial [Bubo scandiacus]
MEQGGRRRAFGSICPNRVQGPPARLAKKPARPGGGAAGTPPAALSPRAPPPPPAPQRRPAGPRRTRPRTHHHRLAGFGSLCPDPSHHPGRPCDPAAGNPPGWGRLGRPGVGAVWAAQAGLSPGLCSQASFLHPSQGPCFQDGQDFDLQEFRDAVDDFISDAATLMPPPVDCTDFDFSLDEAFGPCAPQLESSALVQTASQRLPSPEPCWRDLADQHQKALGHALEANSQLQETLTQRQEELATLRREQRAAEGAGDPGQAAGRRPRDADAPAGRRRGGPSSSTSSSRRRCRRRPGRGLGRARAAGAAGGGGGRGRHAAGGVGEVPRRPAEPGGQPGGQPHAQAPAAAPAPARRLPRAAHRPRRRAPGRGGGGGGRQPAGRAGGRGRHPHPGLPAGQRLHPPHRRRRVPLPLGAAL